MRVCALILALCGAALLPINGPAQSSQPGAQVRAPGSYLGIRLADLDADRAKELKLSEARGVEVIGVEEDSPAEAAGIRKGDVLLAYNGENVIGVQQLIRLVQETPQGRKIKVQVWREGKNQALTITTGAPHSQFDVPPNFFSVNVPDSDFFNVPDIPSPMLIWKNSLFGIECEPVDSQLAQYFGVKHGVLVRSVESGSAADRAGMKAGDVLVGIGDRPISSPRDVTSYLRQEHHPANMVAVSLVRNRKSLTLNIAVRQNQQ